MQQQVVKYVDDVEIKAILKDGLHWKEVKRKITAHFLIKTGKNEHLR